MTDQPFTHSFDLASLGEAERTIELKPSASERAAIASWAGIDALDAFSASVQLQREGTDAYAYEGSFQADVTQSCVVTLAPVKAHLEGEVTRRFRVVAQRRRRTPEPEEAPEDDDETEVLPAGVLNLARPILEDFALAIDPYPRVPGAVFEAPQDEDQGEARRENPFAALEKLKREP
jgi:uncharacterized metal-binding protein YceD (DUF177 family)